MSDYFEEVAAGLRAAVARQAHLPWYRRTRVRRRRVLVVLLAGLLAAGTALAATGTFDSGTTVVSASCEISTARTTGTFVHPCVFVLGDGSRFSCPPTFARTLQSADTLEHARACTRLRSLAIPAPWQPVVVQIRKVATCLSGAGLQVSGGPSLGVAHRDPSSPVGELTVQNSNSPILVGFYLSARVAEQSELAVIHSAGSNERVERRGNVIVLWASSSPGRQRGPFERCAFS